MSNCFFGSPPIHNLVLYDNIVFVFLATKYSLSLSLSLSSSLFSFSNISPTITSQVHQFYHRNPQQGSNHKKALFKFSCHWNQFKIVM